MQAVLEAKFAPESHFAAALLRTNEAFLLDTGRAHTQVISSRVLVIMTLSASGPGEVDPSDIAEKDGFMCSTAGPLFLFLHRNTAF